MGKRLDSKNTIIIPFKLEVIANTTTACTKVVEDTRVDTYSASGITMEVTINTTMETIDGTNYVCAYLTTS